MGHDTDFNYGANSSGSIAGELTPCMAFLVCPNCRKGHGYCSETAAVLKEAKAQGFEFFQNAQGETMIQRGNNSGSQRGGARRNQGVPFLTIEKLTSERQPATILAARLQDDNFKPGGPQIVVVKLLLKSNTYLWTLRNNNPNLDVLIDAFGPDESTWESRKIAMYYEEDNFDGKKWIRVEAISEPAGKRK